MASMNLENPSDGLKVGIAQIAPVWLNREHTLMKVVKYVDQAANEGCRLVAFGEALLPGYPFWIEVPDGARFNSPV
jgi:nitrilase